MFEFAIENRTMNERATTLKRDSLKPVLTVRDELSVKAHDRSGVTAFPLLLLVIDAAFRVVSSPFENDLDELANGVPQPDIYDRLTRVVQPRLHPVLRNLWEMPRAGGVARQMVIPPLHALSLMPLVDIGEGKFAVLTVEALRSSANLHSAVAQFALTPRETQILALIFDGTSGPQMAAMLDLAESTVQSYFKKLLEKTCSPNRHGMVAKILGWQLPTR